VPVRMPEEKVRINRILMIDEAIRSGRFPAIAALARKAEVNGRTIQRDIEYRLYGGTPDKRRDRRLRP
jgi:predicted DNA-binding transcriptional regulator YafY